MAYLVPGPKQVPKTNDSFETIVFTTVHFRPVCMVITNLSPERALPVSTIEASRTSEVKGQEMEEGVTIDLPRIITEMKTDVL